MKTAEEPIRWDYEARWARVRRELERHRADAFVVRHSGNVRYLACAHMTGGAPVSMLIIPRRSAPVGIVSGMEMARARGETALSEFVVYSPYRDMDRQCATEKDALRRVRAKLGLKRIMADCSLPDAKAVVSSFVRDMREIKDACELDCLRRSARLVALGAAELVKIVKVGRSELDVAADLEYFLRRHGAQGMSYPTIVGTGPHTAYAHHAPSGRVIRDGDPVTCDYGVFVDGYASDITRTLLMGRAGRWRGIYDAVLAAQAASARRVKPGVTLKSVDAAGRDLLRRRGLAGGFVHSTGHGIGLETHEGPGVSPFAKGRCRAGMVVTLEPGVYIPGEGGVRIEDAVLVTDTGIEWLSGPCGSRAVRA